MKAPIPIFRPSAVASGERRHGFERLAGLLGPKPAPALSPGHPVFPIEHAVAAAGLHQMVARYDPVQGLLLCSFTAAKRPALTSEATCQAER